MHLLYYCFIVKILAENIYISTNESRIIEAHKYFSGTNLNISSSSPQVVISKAPTLKKLSEIKYNTTEVQSDINFQLLSVGEINYKYYVANNVGSTIFVYKFDLNAQDLMYIAKLEFNETIQETYLWTNDNKDYLLVLTKAEEVNFVFLIQLNSTLTILSYDFWDLRHVKGLRSSEILLGRFIPFIGNLYNQSILYIYDFNDPISPSLKFIYTNESFQNAIDLSLTISPGNLYQFFIVCQSIGLIRFSYYSDSETFNITTLLIKNATLNDIAITFSINTLSTQNLDCLLIGSSVGIFAINATDMSQLFLIKGVENQSLCAGFLFQSLFFITQENLKLIAVYDIGSDRILMYDIDVHDIIQDFYKSKWHIAQWPDGNFIIVSSNSNNLVLYNLTLAIPTITLNMNDTDYVALVSDGKESVYFNVMTIKNFSKIYYLEEYHDPVTLEPSIEVLFKGFTSSLSIDPQSIISGRNLSFEFNLSLFDNSTFSITYGNFDKLLYMNTINLDFSYQSILILNQRLFFIDDTHIKEFSITNFSSLILIKIYEYNKIFRVVKKDINEILFSYNDELGHYYIWINSSYSISTSFPCEYLETILTYIICGYMHNIDIFNFTETSEYSLITKLSHKNTIKDLAVWLNKNTAVLLILDNEHYLHYSFLEYINSINITKYDTELHIKKIMSSGNTLFIVCYYQLYVYTYDMVLKSLEVPYKDYDCVCLESFAYLFETSTPSLTIVDTYRDKLNSYFLETNFDPECRLLNVGFFNYQALILQSCPSNNTLKIFTSTCPSYGDYRSCIFKLPFEIKIINTQNLKLGSYKNKFSVIGKNSFDQLSFNVTLNLIVYGQAVVTKNDSLVDFNSIDYDYGYNIKLLEVFSGNNMEFSMDVKSKKNLPVDDFCPYELVQRFESKVIYSSNYTINTLSSIPFKNILLFSDEKTVLSLYDTSYNQVLNISGVEDLNSMFDNCNIVKFLFEVDPFVYVALLCNLVQKDFIKYYNGKMNIINTDLKNGLSILKFNIKNLKLMSCDVYPLDIVVRSMQLVYDGSSKVIILFISKILQNTNSEYVNNQLGVYNFKFFNEELKLNSFLTIDYRSLSLNRLYITSVNGIILKNLVLVTVDKYTGLRILKINQSEVSIYKELKHKPRDFFTSVTLTYKQINIITSSAKILVYNWDQNLNLKYYSTRFPYSTGSTDIYSIPSSVTYESFFYNNFLVFTVMYDNKRKFFRIIDNRSIYSSSLIKDVEYTCPDNNILSPHIEFTDNITSYFISNMNEISRIILNEPKFVKKKIGKKEYDRMVDKYGGDEFIVNILAKNDNNNDSTGSATCKVVGYSDRNDSSSASNSNWLIAVLSVSLLIALIIAVTIVYKCVFTKEKKLERTRSNLELVVNYSIIQ